MKTIERIVRDAAPHWVGDGFPVRSLFSYGDGNRFDPFLLLDYAGPYEFAPSDGMRGVGEHPHRGFETVTIVYQGELAHGDSGGHRGTIGPGDVQWMTAASGVAHREHHSERFAREGGVLEMVQLWVNLPAKDKTSPPRYQALLSAQIPVVHLPSTAGTVRVIAGDFGGAAGPARTFTPIRLLDVRLARGGATELEVADGHTTALVVQRGRIKVNDATSVGGVEVVEFERAGSRIALEAEEDAMALLLSGAPIGEPVVGQGPFVMNTREEIQRAMRDYRDGKMGQLS